MLFAIKYYKKRILWALCWKTWTFLYFSVTIQSQHLDTFGRMNVLFHTRFYYIYSKEQWELWWEGEAGLEVNYNGRVEWVGIILHTSREEHLHNWCSRQCNGYAVIKTKPMLMRTQRIGW